MRIVNKLTLAKHSIYSMAIGFCWLLLFAPTVATEAPWVSRQLSPQWSEAVPLRTITFGYDSDKSEIANGKALAEALGQLIPGDQLLIESGRYVMERKLSLNVSGTDKNPIWIEGSDTKHLPVISRIDARQNVLNVGERSASSHIVIRNLEFTGGSTLIRLYDCHHIWLDQCPVVSSCHFL